MNHLTIYCRVATDVWGYFIFYRKNILIRTHQ